MYTSRRVLSSVPFRNWNSKKIGFVGLGNMGKPMAMNLRKAGHELVVFDLNRSAIDELVTLGAKSASSAGDVAAQVEVLISMVPATKHVRGIYEGPDGIFKRVHPNSFLIDCSTIDPVAAKDIHKIANSEGHHMIDAPVSGGVMGAQNGTLTFMVGATEEEFKFATPILSHMGKRIVHCGASGMGSAVKVCNNLILGVSMIGTAEGFRLADRLGVDPAVFASVVNTSSGRCWASEVSCPAPGVISTAPASRDYNGGFGTDLMLKDVRLALEAAAQCGVGLPLTAETAEIYNFVSHKGFGNKDFGVVYREGENYKGASLKK
eukprot:GDKJ01018272.1.p1 GENE.GDKJ01018272.1~~GDKJ01018272.1.p1  ORF type:complete len:320 (+),score=74.59 GDKJ01018272.1:25-984(+)